MSRLLKYSSVAVDPTEHLIVDTAQSDAPGPERTDPNGGGRTAEQILSDAHFRAHSLYRAQRKQAFIEVYQKETEWQARESAKQIEDARQTSERALAELKAKLESDYVAAVAERDAQVVEFAFGLAEKILGIPVDRERFYSGRYPEIPGPEEERLPKAAAQDTPLPGAARSGSGLRRDETEVPPALEDYLRMEDASGDWMETPAAAVAASTASAVPASQPAAQEDLPERRAGEASLVAQDLGLLDRTSLSRLAKNVNLRELVLALKGNAQADDVIGRLPKRMQATILEEMEFLGEVGGKDVEDAAKQVGRTLRRLEKAGEIKIDRE